MTFAAPRQQPDDRERTHREWLAELRMGDGHAFELIFREFAARLCDFALSYVRNRECAEEIVQDLFCRLWEQRFTIEMPHGMTPYLHSAVRNRSLNALRERRLELAFHERSRQNAPARPALPDAELSAQDLAEAAARVVASMPSRCREVYTLVRQQHLSHADTARVLGISPKTVEVHMTRALAILRAELAGWFEP
jgi:RNA polymerase sigma-70 factor (ECF subfamily)